MEQLAHQDYFVYFRQGLLYLPFGDGLSGDVEQFGKLFLSETIVDP